MTSSHRPGWKEERGGREEEGRREKEGVRRKEGGGRWKKEGGRRKEGGGRRIGGRRRSSPSAGGQLPNRLLKPTLLPPHLHWRRNLVPPLPTDSLPTPVRLC